MNLTILDFSLAGKAVVNSMALDGIDSRLTVWEGHWRGRLALRRLVPLLVAAIILCAGSAQAKTIFADGSLKVASCSNYDPATRQCRGGSDVAHGGRYGLENASEASSPGDTIYVREFNGQYLGTKDLGRVAIWPKGGTSESRMSVIEGYQIEQPLIYVMQNLNYVHLKNVILDGNNDRGIISLAGVDHSIIENVEVRNAGEGGISGVSNSLLLNMNVHDNGYNGKGGNFSGDPSMDQCPPINKNGGQCHGIYFEGPNVIIEGGEWHHNSGYGIHCYPHCESVIVRDANIHDNGATGLIFAFSGNNRVENTISESNGALGFLLSGPNDVADHVTSYNNRSGGICTGGPDVTIRNSIVLDGISPC